jgi:hypothetical protein
MRRPVMKVVYTRLSKDEHKRLFDHAARHGVPVSFIVRQAIKLILMGGVDDNLLPKE